MDKFCKDCKHVNSGIICDSPKTDEIIDRVSGTTQKMFSYCKDQRDSGFLFCRILGTCGKEGRFFEAREEPIEPTRRDIIEDGYK